MPSATKNYGLHDAFQAIMSDKLLLTQCVYEPTHAGNIIDLAFVSRPNAILNCQVLPPIIAYDIQAHQAVLLTYANAVIDKKKSQPVEVSSFGGVDLNQLDAATANIRLSLINWRNIFQHAISVILLPVLCAFSMTSSCNLAHLAIHVLTAT